MTEIRSDREFILDRNNWPRWPVLPMKRLGSNPRSAFLVAEQVVQAEAGHPFKLDVIRFVPPNDSEFEPTEYASIDEMLADGWQVD